VEDDFLDQATGRGSPGDDRKPPQRGTDPAVIDRRYQ
jgi:hypothetical protein